MRWRTTLQNKKILRNTLLNIVTRKKMLSGICSGQHLFRLLYYSFLISILLVFFSILGIFFLGRCYSFLCFIFFRFIFFSFSLRSSVQRNIFTFRRIGIFGGKIIIEFIQKIIRVIFLFKIVSYSGSNCTTNSSKT